MDKQKIYDILIVLGECYSKGEFDAIFEYMDEECVWESQWVIEAKTGIENVKEYYQQKSKSLKGNNSKCSYKIVEIHTGKLAVLITQKLENETKDTMLEVKFSDDFKILRIDVCNPAFYSYRDFRVFEK